MNYLFSKKVKAIKEDVHGYTRSEINACTGGTCTEICQQNCTAACFISCGSSCDKTCAKNCAVSFFLNI